MQPYEYHHGDVLGTAMDLTVVATSRADADAARATIGASSALQAVTLTYGPAGGSRLRAGG